MSAHTASFRSRGMTLLELLGVILVCFILWSFIFPASETMVRNGRRRQAAADVHMLATAVLAYRQEYGFFPGQDGNWDSDIVYLPEECTAPGTLNAVDAKRLLQCLSNTNEVDNPRAVLFLEDLPSRMVDDVFKDPWGDPYVVVADGNADGWIGESDTAGNIVSAFDVTDTTFAGNRRHEVPGIRERVYVFSWGDSYTNSISTAEAPK